jgi:hypothetical protein
MLDQKSFFSKPRISYYQQESWSPPTGTNSLHSYCYSLEPGRTDIVATGYVINKYVHSYLSGNYIGSLYLAERFEFQHEVCAMLILRQSHRLLRKVILEAKNEDLNCVPIIVDIATFLMSIIHKSIIDVFTEKNIQSDPRDGLSGTLIKVDHLLKKHTGHCCLSGALLHKYKKYRELTSYDLNLSFEVLAKTIGAQIFGPPIDYLVETIGPNTCETTVKAIENIFTRIYSDLINSMETQFADFSNALEFGVRDYPSLFSS